jgi:uncharacterized RDD family membrane protein YckC
MSDDQLILEIPEQVEVSLELAGLASRTVAYLIDAALQGVLVGLAMLGLGLTGALGHQDVDVGLRGIEADGLLSTDLPMVLMAAIGLLTFTIFWGYHVFFELAGDGRTPGKRLLGLRVLQDTGTPVTLAGSLVRNLIRVIDFLPLYYGLGLVALLTNGRNKRLGDMAAGTIVIRERRPRTMRRAPPPSPALQGALRLDPRVETLIAAFLEQRHGLPPARRLELARRLALPLQARYGGAGLDAELYLEELLAAYRYGVATRWATASAPPPGNLDREHR